MTPNAPRVLVADDEALLRTLATRVLERAGIEVLPAPDSASALRELKNEPRPTAVVLDLTLPPGGGAELVRSIRELAPDTPLVLTSGDALPEDCRAFLDPPNVVFLAKPFAPAALVRALSEAFKAI